MDAYQIAKNIELLLSSEKIVSTILNYCIFLYFQKVPKEMLAEAVSILLQVYPEYEHELEDCYDYIMGNGTAWFKFPFECILTNFDLSTGEISE